MKAFARGIESFAPVLRGPWRRSIRRSAGVLLAALMLAALPAEIRPPALTGAPEIGVATALAQNRGGGRGGGNASERSSGPDRDRSRPDRDRGSSRPDRDRGGPDRDRGGPDRDDRDDRAGRADRDAPTRAAARDADSTVATPESPAAAAMGRALGQREGDPGTAPTEASTGRARAMVEIAKDLGAAAPARSGQPRISGAVTQDMLDAAEQRYVDAVRDAWEAHGFPWNDSDVLDSLDELESLVSALESIIGDQDGGAGGGRVVTDVNEDGFVDINDLWDAHLQ